jgi:hypothetical protein
MNETVIGWVTAYDNPYKSSPFTKEKRKALIERIRKRRYNFQHFDHEMLSHGAPFYNDNTFCILTKQQWDSVMQEAYSEMPRGERLMPVDAITRPAKRGILFEKDKFETEGDYDHG